MFQGAEYEGGVCNQCDEFVRSMLGFAIASSSITHSN